MTAKQFGIGKDRKPQPRKCPSCGGRLPDAVYERPSFKIGNRIFESYGLDGRYRIRCKCGTVLEWTHPGIWEATRPVEPGRNEVRTNRATDLQPQAAPGRD